MKYLFILLSLSFMACPKLKNDSISNQNNIQGKWKWIESSFMTRGMSEPRISTPKTAGHTIILEFKDATVDVYRNGKVMASYQYEIKKMSPDNQLFLNLKIQNPNSLAEFEFRLSSGPCNFKNGMLEITGGYNDAGENQKYKRM